MKTIKLINSNEVAMVDDEDYEWLVAMGDWCLDDGYACLQSSIITKMHQLILSSYSGLQRNHIDRNRLNNQRNNIEFSTPQLNSMDRKKREDNTSGVVGVNWNIRAEKWFARVNDDNGKRISLGYFTNIEEAKLKVEAYNKAKTIRLRAALGLANTQI